MILSAYKNMLKKHMGAQEGLYYAIYTVPGWQLHERVRLGLSTSQ